PFGAHGRTRGLQLRHFLDLDDADPTGTVDADAGVVAVVGHRDAVLDRGLKDGLAFLNSDLTTIDRQRDGFHPLIISIGSLTPAPAWGFGAPGSGRIPSGRR